VKRKKFIKVTHSDFRGGVKVDDVRQHQNERVRERVKKILIYQNMTSYQLTY
jgi:hypothetical protein